MSLPTPLQTVAVILKKIKPLSMDLLWPGMGPTLLMWEVNQLVLVQKLFLNDSEAILQYLDANYPETPRLFPRLKASRKECSAWHEMVDVRLARLLDSGETWTVQV